MDLAFIILFLEQLLYKKQINQKTMTTASITNIFQED